MNNAPLDFPASILLPQRLTRNGAVTAARLKRFNIGYAIMCILGALPYMLDWGTAAQATGWGLWFPGAGFLALGGWSVLGTLFTGVIFAFAFIAWFGSGMIIAPIIVWLGSALIAGAMAGDVIWPGTQWLVPFVTLAGAAYLAYRGKHSFDKKRQIATERNRYLPEAYKSMCASQTQRPEEIQHELDDDQIGTLRWLLDRALQPVGQLEGFNHIDQFQTASLRYQINYIGYALGLAQRHYTPNFHGYMSEAQRRLIEQYLQPKVWSYWRLENAWGNFSLNADPAQKDNIMLTGYLNLQVCLYMNNTGDMRYSEPGSLTFKMNDELSFPHDVHSINQSLLDNFLHYNEQYCLYPCEPNWIYPACNFFGMNALVTYDVVFGTDQASQFRDNFREKFESEFLTPDGGVVPLRSKLTGHALPFPMPDAVNVILLSPIYPDLAARYWTMARHESIIEKDGVKEFHNSAPAVDFGTYTKGYLSGAETLMSAAVEFGDEEAAEFVQEQINVLCSQKSEAGRRYYDGASTVANASYARTAFGFKNAWHDAAATPAPESALKGPLLAEVNFPVTVVARAVSNGDDLEMVLVAEGEVTHKLEFSRLKAGAEYTLKGDLLAETFTATQEGTASIEIAGAGRQALHLTSIA